MTAVVNQAFVRRFSPDRDVLGRRFRVPALDSAWATVVGVVETADLGAGPGAREERIYRPFAQVDVPAPTLVVRAQGDDGAALAPAVRRAVAEVDAGLPLTGVRTLADLLRFMTRAQATLGFLGASGGFAGLLVAVVGLYGLLAFRVRQRRRELGVRMALGADGPGVAVEVLRSAFRQLVPATVVGLALAWLAAPLLAAFTLGADPRNPVMYLAVGGAFLALGALAALPAALRAARTDPARALHGE